MGLALPAPVALVVEGAWFAGGWGWAWLDAARTAPPSAIKRTETGDFMR